MKDSGKPSSLRAGGEIRNEKGEIDRVYTSLLKINKRFRKNPQALE